MKKAIFLIFLLSINSFISFSQSCLPEGITFLWQWQIDNFPNEYPWCSQIEGDVEINCVDITNLDGLSGITSIGGELEIIFASDLADISGLSSLTSVGWTLIIEDLDLFTSLDDLNSLEYVGGALIITDNDNLTSLDGLQNLDSVGQGINISHNPQLIDLTGLNNLSSSNSFSIGGNSSLQNLNGLQNITFIYYLTISSNPSLTSLWGLNNLTHIEFELSVFSCNALQNLSGLNNLTSIRSIKLKNNDALINLTGLESLPVISQALKIIDNDSFVNLEGLTSLSSILNFLIIEENDNLTSLIGADNLTSIGDSLVIRNNDALTSLEGLGSLNTIGLNLSIHHNSSLAGIEGLNNLAFIGQDFKVAENSQLLAITGLENLSVVGRNLSIHGNDLLTSLSGLDYIDPETILNLTIFDNPSLTRCEIQSICDYLANPNGIVTIHSNGTGCDNPPEVAEACGMPMLCLPNGNYYLYTQAEIDSFQSDYSGCTQLSGEVYVSGINITNLDGLNMVTSIDGNLNIRENDSLDNMMGLLNLVNLGNLLWINNNNSLTSLSGLDNINLGVDNRLGIMLNHQLSVCDVASVCYFINNFGSLTYIYDNSTGCDNLNQVAENCGTLGIAEENSQNIAVSPVRVFPNPGRGYTNFIINNSHFQYVELATYNMYGQVQDILVSEYLPAGEYSILWNAQLRSPGIYCYRMVTETQSLSGKILITE